MFEVHSHHHAGELVVSAMLGNPLLRSVGDLFSPCWRTSLLCHEEFLYKGPLPFPSVASPLTTLLRVFALAAPSAWNSSPPHPLGALPHL